MQTERNAQGAPQIEDGITLPNSKQMVMGYELLSIEAIGELELLELDMWAFTLYVRMKGTDNKYYQRLIVNQTKNKAKNDLTFLQGAIHLARVAAKYT